MTDVFESSEIVEQVTCTGITVRFVDYCGWGRFVLRKSGCPGAIQMAVKYDGTTLDRLKKWKEQK